MECRDAVDAPPGNQLIGEPAYVAENGFAFSYRKVKHVAHNQSLGHVGADERALQTKVVVVLSCSGRIEPASERVRISNCLRDGIRSQDRAPARKRFSIFTCIE